MADVLVLFLCAVVLAALFRTVLLARRPAVHFIRFRKYQIGGTASVVDIGYLYHLSFAKQFRFLNGLYNLCSLQFQFHPSSPADVTLRFSPESEFCYLVKKEEECHCQVAD